MISLPLILGFIRKEFRQMLRDPRMRILLFVTPSIQLIIFGLALSTDVKNIRLWTIQNNNDYILQHIFQHSTSDRWFLPSKIGNNISNKDNHSDPFILLRSGKVDAALIPPPGGLTKALGRESTEVQNYNSTNALSDDSANLQLLIDATNVIQAQSVESYIKTISGSVLNRDLKRTVDTPPINFAIRVLYNPSLETAYFMVPGVLSILLCITSILLTSMSITREKEIGTFEMLISAPISGLEIILGKTIPFIILGMVNLPFILLIAIGLFGVPMRGSLLVLFIAGFMFVLSAVGIGVMISTIAKNQQQSMLGGFLFLFPAILLSGMMFPIDNMPLILKWLAYADPLSHFLSLVRNILLKGGETAFLIKHIVILFCMAMIFIYISFKRFRTTLG